MRGASCPFPCQQDQPYLLPRKDAGPDLPSVAVSEEQGQLSSLLKEVRGQGLGIFPYPHHHMADEGLFSWLVIDGGEPRALWVGPLLGCAPEFYKKAG